MGLRGLRARRLSRDSWILNLVKRWKARLRRRSLRWRRYLMKTQSFHLYPWTANRRQLPQSRSGIFVSCIFVSINRDKHIVFGWESTIHPSSHQSSKAATSPSFSGKRPALLHSRRLISSRRGDMCPLRSGLVMRDRIAGCWVVGRGRLLWLRMVFEGAFCVLFCVILCEM